VLNLDTDNNIAVSMRQRCIHIWVTTKYCR